MSDEPLDHFDDPELKSALKRTCGKECCPFALRQRITALTVATASAGPIRRPGLWRGMSPAYRAMAAMLLLAMGVTAWLVRDSFLPTDPISNPSHYANAALPQTLAADMVKKHDACSDLPAHHEYPDVPRTDFPQLASLVSAELGRPALVMDVGHGWEFQGAATCGVGPYRSGHAVFKKGSQELSIFSMPPVVPCVKGRANTYEMETSDHPIAGFGTTDGLYCLVGSDRQHRMKLRDVVILRDELQAQARFATRRDNGPRQVMPVVHQAAR